MKKRSLIITIASAGTVAVTGLVLLILYLSGVIFIKEFKIIDFKQYSSVEDMPISINVTFNDEYIGSFVIDDEEQIKEV
jgi:hypothetical protein